MAPRLRSPSRGTDIPHLVEGPLVHLIRKAGLSAYGGRSWADVHRRGDLLLPIGTHNP